MSLTHQGTRVSGENNEENQLISICDGPIYLGKFPLILSRYNSLVLVEPWESPFQWIKMNNLNHHLSHWTLGSFTGKETQVFHHCCFGAELIVVSNKCFLNIWINEWMNKGIHFPASSMSSTDWLREDKEYNLYRIPLSLLTIFIQNVLQSVFAY